LFDARTNLATDRADPPRGALAAGRLWLHPNTYRMYECTLATIRASW